MCPWNPSGTSNSVWSLLLHYTALQYLVAKTTIFSLTVVCERISWAVLCSSQMLAWSELIWRFNSRLLAGGTNRWPFHHGNPLATFVTCTPCIISVSSSQWPPPPIFTLQCANSDSPSAPLGTPIHWAFPLISLSPSSLIRAHRASLFPQMPAVYLPAG